jgi:nitroreductase/FMN reductase [NAD(P)H]
VVPVAGLALGYPDAKEPLSARLALAATVHTDRYDKAAVERELDAYGARRGKDWIGDKVKQYSAVWRGDFGAYVTGKGYRLV